jgi:radical SAM superfamily enzyme YgiQ (UPF0313 family)
MRRAITFVHSPVVDYGQNYGTRFAPLWAFTLAAHVPPGFERRLLDCRSEDPRKLAFADVFAFSGINQDLPEILRVQALLKARHPRALFILGGPITWSFHEEGRLELLAAFDYVFLLDGEETLPRFLRALSSGALAELPRLIRAERFDVSQAKPIDFELYRQSSQAGRYYGAAIEVSRGCPFLCEFCDIRSVPGNDRPHNKPVALIVEELQRYTALGISQFLFVCDNFIGDLRWARACADAIVAWRQRTGAQPSIFTWLTLNLATQPELMRQLRRAGFSVLYIGVESANQDALRETAKLQNLGDLRGKLEKIHGHGFVIAPGLIFGFDSDTGTVFDDTLALIAEAGLIGGDPSFLTALPGTPLFERMRRTGRLAAKADQATERRKIVTNIRYLQDPVWLRDGFTRFMAKLTSANYQLSRFERHLEILLRSPDFVEHVGEGFGSPLQYLQQQWQDGESRRMLVARVRYLALSPSNALTVLRALRLWQRAEKVRSGFGLHFYFWLYFWTNLGLKYQDLSPADFELHGAPAGLGVEEVARDALAALVSVESLLQAGSKPKAQARHTSNALSRLAGSHARAEERRRGARSAP